MKPISTFTIFLIYLVSSNSYSISNNNEMTPRLGLSAWELDVITDLTFKLTEAKCSKINADTLASYQQFFSDSFKQVPPSESQHEEFLGVYSNLVLCLDNLSVKGVLPSTDGVQQMTFIHNPNGKSVKEAASSESEWILTEPNAKSEDTSTAPTPIKVKSGLMFDLDSIGEWVMSFFSSKTKKEDIYKPKKSERQLKMYHNARQNIANFFHSATKIMKNACPATYHHDKDFMRQAMLDMVDWATRNEHKTIATSTLYFTVNGLLDSINSCVKRL